MAYGAGGGGVLKIFYMGRFCPLLYHTPSIDRKWYLSHISTEEILYPFLLGLFETF